MVTFKPGDKVKKNPATWTAYPEVDVYGRGEGVGVVVDAQWDDFVDVRWDGGRYYENVDELELVNDA
jgi:hypothetical protein